MCNPIVPTYLDKCNPYNYFIEDVPESENDSDKMECRAGVDPAITVFADLRVSRFATGAIQFDCPGLVAEAWD